MVVLAGTPVLNVSRCGTCKAFVSRGESHCRRCTKKQGKPCMQCGENIALTNQTGLCAWCRQIMESAKVEVSPDCMPWDSFFARTVTGDTPTGIGPIFDGIETSDKIKESNDIPIIFLTEYGDKKSVERSMHVQPKSYIMKPFNIQEVHSNIQLALQIDKMEEKLK